MLLKAPPGFVADSLFLHRHRNPIVLAQAVHNPGGSARTRSGDSPHRPVAKMLGAWARRFSSVTLTSWADTPLPLQIRSHGGELRPLRDPDDSLGLAQVSAPMIVGGPFAPTLNPETEVAVSAVRVVADAGHRPADPDVAFQSP